MPGLARIKQCKRSIVARHARPDDASGLIQVLNTVLPLAALWYAAARGAQHSWAIPVLATVAMSLFLLRVFVLMHECGHGSLFRSPRLNRAFGFVFGVISGMPQYVWAQHHNFHHATNGNWARYRGPLATLSVDEYEALTPRQQRRYWNARHIRMAPFGGFVYLLLNPRLTWLKGTAALLLHLARGGDAEDFRTPYWTSRAEYWHMALNNLALGAAVTAMAWLVGPMLFFPVWIASTSLAGGGGLVLFTVQHNFEHAYASAEDGWDYDAAALDGTSFLQLPGWLNWFTASIGYHHVHHLSARIPNYRLALCHEENADMFAGVRRLALADIVPALKCLLWDPRARRIISVAEHERARRAAAGPL